MLVMTWNLGNNQHTHRIESEYRFWDQLTFIRHISPDIACLQEARWWSDDGHARLLTFEATTGLRAFLGPAQSGLHTIIAVRPSTVTPLAHTYDNRIEHVHNKLMIDVAPKTQPWTVVSTHLTEANGDTRLHEATRLLDLADTPSIIAGTLHCPGLNDPPTNFAGVEKNVRLRYTTIKAEHTESTNTQTDDRRTIRLLSEIGFTDAATARTDLTTPASHTTGHRDSSHNPSQRQDHILLNCRNAFHIARSSYAVLDTEATRALSRNLPIVTELVT